MQPQTIIARPLALSEKIHYITGITRAVPLVRKVNAHQGRVFYFPEPAAVGRAV